MKKITLSEEDLDEFEVYCCGGVKLPDSFFRQLEPIPEGLVGIDKHLAVLVRLHQDGKLSGRKYGVDEATSLKMEEKVALLREFQQILDIPPGGSSELLIV